MLFLLLETFYKWRLYERGEGKPQMILYLIHITPSLSSTKLVNRAMLSRNIYLNIIYWFILMVYMTTYWFFQLLPQSPFIYCFTLPSPFCLTLKKLKSLCCCCSLLNYMIHELCYETMQM